MLEILVKSAYGRKIYYPLNDAAKSVLKLTKTETLTAEAVEVLRGLGLALMIKEEICSKSK